MDRIALGAVALEIIEKVMEIAPGVEYEFWTYGGTVPGIRACPTTSTSTR